MSSALKPALPAAGVAGVASVGVAGVASVGAAAGSPAKAAVAAAAAGLPQALPQGALVGQNLSQHALAVPHPSPHPAPSMAPVSANMAQMAQNMSHHGNLSHVTQNSVPQPSAGPVPPSPAKPPAAVGAPLSLVQDKPQPLALTRTLDKKELDVPAQSNGTLELPKSATNPLVALKPQNQEPNKDKRDIAKTSPSTPKPLEKPVSAQNTPQKAEVANAGSQGETPTQPKAATANEAPEKSPSKPTEPKLAPTADVAPTQSDSKPAPESANSQVQEKPSSTTPQKVEPAVVESAKVEAPKVEDKKEEPKVEKPAQNGAEEKKEVAKVETSEPAKKEEKPDSAEKQEKEKPEPKVEDKVEKKVEEKKPAKVEIKTKGEAKGTPKSTLKLATVTPAMRKRRQTSPKASEGAPPAKKLDEGDASTPESRSKRNRTQVQLYQSPTPELTMATKLSASAGRSTPTKQNDDKLIVIYKNEYLAVRNAEGGFYVCQAMQNVYRTTRKIKIRWLSQDKTADPSGETYKPDFYDVTDMECVLTTLSLSRGSGGGGAQLLRASERGRAQSILRRALQAGQGAGEGAGQLTEEHPDGLDLSLFTDESQLEKMSRKRTNSKSSPRKRDSSLDAKAAATPAKKARTTPKRSPKQTPPKQNNKRTSAGSTPTVAPASKKATAVTEKKSKSTPKRTPAKKVEDKTDSPPTPVNNRAGRRTAAAVKEMKPSPSPVPSTSTGKSTRTPRKPPNKK